MLVGGLIALVLSGMFRLDKMVSHDPPDLEGEVQEPLASETPPTLDEEGISVPAQILSPPVQKEGAAAAAQGQQTDEMSEELVFQMESEMGSLRADVGAMRAEIQKLITSLNSA